MTNNLSNFVESELNNIFKLNEKQKIGIAGFYMMAIVRQSFVKTNSVPIIPLENGSYATDHIINNPLSIEIEGTVSNIYKDFGGVQEAYIKALGTVGNITRFLPSRTREQINKINEFIQDTQNLINKIDDYINVGQQIVNIFSANSQSKTLTQQFIDVINALMDSRQIIKIELPNLHI